MLRGLHRHRHPAASWLLLHSTIVSRLSNGTRDFAEAQVGGHISGTSVEILAYVLNMRNNAAVTDPWTINDWYLNSEGSAGWSNPDDDRPDRGPDTWLDKLTGPAAPRGKRALVAGGPRSGGAQRRGSDRGRKGRKPTASPGPLDGAATQPARGSSQFRDGGDLDRSRGNRPARQARQARTKPMKEGMAIPGSSRGTDQELAQAVSRLQQQASQSLSYAEVIRRLGTAGRVVTKDDLKRAMRTTNTTWGKPSTRAKNTQRKPPASNTKIAPSRSRMRLRRDLLAEVRRLRTARPDLSAGEMAHHLRTDGRSVTQSEVALALELVQLGRRQSAQPTDSDRALAREASLINARSTRRMTLVDLVRLLRAEGWQTTVRDLDYALLVTRTTLGAPRAKSTEAPWPSLNTRRAPAQMQENDIHCCNACGMVVSNDGYCRCS